MDPDTCLAELRKSLSTRDAESAHDSAECLRDWLNAGGFAPLGVRSPELWRLIRAGLNMTPVNA
jgi:hypothetical protein